MNKIIALLNRNEHLSHFQHCCDAVKAKCDVFNER